MSVVESWPEKAVAVLTIDRDEKRNALNADLCDELAGAILAAVSEGGARAVIITGAGSAFCAGADLSHWDPDGLYPALGRLLETLQTIAVPVIAYVNGPAIGAGAFVAIACDIRVVAPEAHFAIPVAKMGVEIDTNLARSITSLLGGARARAMLMTGAPLGASDAVSCGFAMTEGTLDDATRIASICTSGSPAVQASIKKSFKELG